MPPASFNRRVYLIGMGLLVIGLLTASRLVYLQIGRHGYYKVLANQEQLHKYEIKPTRGEIFIQNRGQIAPLVLNRNLKTLYVDTHYVVDKESTAKQLAAITGDAAADYAK